MKVSQTANRILSDITAAAIHWRRNNGPQEQIAELVDRLYTLPSYRFEISKHALERFRTRLRKDITLEEARSRMRTMLDSAKEVELKEQWRVIQLLNHDCKEARYFKFNQWIMVVSGSSVVTCYRDEAGRWR